MAVYTAIDDPSAHFQTLLYTGDGNDDRNMVNTGNSDLQPDWIWIKDRDNARSHEIYDSLRGATKRLKSESTSAENTSANNLQAFQSDGFQVGSGPGVNGGSASPGTYVAWQWKANGAGSTNTDGTMSETVTVSANADAGFSIVKYTGSGTSGNTVGHGLSEAPELVIAKSRNSVGSENNWVSYHAGLGPTYKILLNDDAAKAETSNWDDTAPTSSVFTVNPSDSGTNTDGEDYIAYTFHSVQGYSKFGSYRGNNSADGTFVYTGFKPAWIIFKRTDSSSNWHILDSKRDTVNEADATLRSNTNGAEFESSNDVDFLSNGFKCRSNEGSTNTSAPYSYMAFAEAPFVTSGGVPCTAR